MGDFDLLSDNGHHEELALNMLIMVNVESLSRESAYPKKVPLFPRFLPRVRDHSHLSSVSPFSSKTSPASA